IHMQELTKAHVTASRAGVNNLISSNITQYYFWHEESKANHFTHQLLGGRDAADSRRSEETEPHNQRLRATRCHDSTEHRTAGRRSSEQGPTFCWGTIVKGGKICGEASVEGNQGMKVCDAGFLSCAKVASIPLGGRLPRHGYAATMAKACFAAASVF